MDEIDANTVLNVDEKDRAIGLLAAGKLSETVLHNKTDDQVVRLVRACFAANPLPPRKYPSCQFLSIHHHMPFHLLISSFYSPSNFFLLVL